MKDFLSLGRLLASSWKGMLLATAFSFLTISSNIALLAVSALLIAKAAYQPPVLDLMVLIVGVRFFGIARAVCRYLERYFAHDVTFKILKKIRVAVYQNIEPLAPAKLFDYRSGDLLSRIVADVETLKEFYLRVLAPPLTALLVLIAVFVFLACFSFRVALILLVFFLLGGVIVPLLMAGLSRGVKKRMGEIKSELNAQLVDSIQGMTEIIVYGQTGRQLQEIGRLGRELSALQSKMARLSGLSQTFTQSAMNLAFWGTLFTAIPLVHSGRIEGVYLAMLALTTVSSFEAILPLPLIYAYGEESLAAWQRIGQISGAAAGITPNQETLQPADYSLEIKNLRFRYKQDQPWIIDGLNFSLPQGSSLGITGPNGTGKSTLVNLLLGFYAYAQGSILVGGRELKDFRQEDGRNLFGVVSQQTYLFNTTVRENLLLAKPEAGEAELLKAAQRAGIHDFILSLPHGYDTYIGEGGYKLSGGQRQRLAIARVLLKDAPILILDEAEANLDPIAAREVMQSLVDIRAGKTTLVISHRPQILEKLDQILVFAAGAGQEDLSFLSRQNRKTVQAAKT
jgi:ATP-binding cassette subfamily C protein CydC